MPRKLAIEQEAEADLADAFAWYETQRPGLGSELLAEVARVLKTIEEFPERHPIARGITRRVPTRRFPYGIYYILDPELIAVTAVLHARRDPRRLEQRTPRP